MAQLSREAEYEFEEAHIKLIWEELHDRFGFNLKVWKPRFHEFLQKQTRATSPMSAFYRFGNENINSILNEILGRREVYPTFNNLVEYVIKSGIKR